MKFLNVLLTMIFALSLSISSAQSPITIGDAPYMISIQSNYFGGPQEHTCNAVILNSEWILSTKFCLEPSHGNWVIAGETYPNVDSIPPPGDVIVVGEVHIHPLFEDHGWNLTTYDLALGKLSEPLTLIAGEVEAIDYANALNFNSTYYNAGQQSKTMGWDYKTPTLDLELLESELTIISSNDANQDLINCGSLDGVPIDVSTYAYSQDSVSTGVWTWGTPAVVEVNGNPIVMGINNRRGCIFDDWKPEIFSNVFEMSSWIDDILLTGNTPCVENPQWTITNDVVWTDEIISYGGNILVTPTGSLTMNNTTLRMAENKKLVFQGGSRFESYDSKLLACDNSTFWGGVETYGIVDIVLDNTLIQHAFHAIDITGNANIIKWDRNQFILNNVAIQVGQNDKILRFIPSTSNHKNLIANCNVGIRAEEGGFDVTMTDFIFVDKAFELIDAPLLSKIWDNEIDYRTSGIEAYNSLFHFSDNRVIHSIGSNVETAGIVSYGSNGYSKIFDNTIKSKDKAIVTYYDDTLEIRDNIIEVLSNDEEGSAVAVTMNLKSANFHDNSILVRNADGILFSSCIGDNYTTRNNIIESIGGIGRSGIRILHSNYEKAQNNTIFGEFDYGIHTENVGFTSLKCNDIESNKYGLYVGEDCHDFDLEGNSIGITGSPIQTYASIWIESELGHQVFKGNIFKSTNLGYAQSYVHAENLGPFELAGTRFDIDPLQSVNPLLPEAWEPTSIIRVRPDYFGQTFDCESGGGNKIGGEINPAKDDTDLLISEIMIYPHPAKDLLYIETTGSYNYLLMDIGGRIVLSGTGQDKIAISIAGLTSGMYVLKTNNQFNKVIISN